MSHVELTYRFRFTSGAEEAITLRWDPDSLEQEVSSQPAPHWTALDFHQCSHCPLKSETHPQCPAAASVMGVIDRFGAILSYEDVTVDVISPQRTVTATMSAQEGIMSLMGALLATSGCPKTAFFKPMAHFHLPFSSSDETLYRAASMYLLGQYLRQQAGGEADFSMQGLVAIYADLQILNHAMAKRLAAAIKRDASINALVLLDYFTMVLPAALNESLESMRPLFHAYLPSNLPPVGWVSIWLPAITGGSALLRPARRINTLPI